MILEGNITIPYKWTTGATIGRFLAELRDNARLVGARCDGCGTVYVPPPDVCGECYKPLADWIALSGEGEAIACTTVERAMPWSPVPPPYTLALIKLDGATTNLLHMVNAGVKAGERVRAVFKPNRTGALLDIEHFISITDAAPANESLQPEPSEAISLESAASGLGNQTVNGGNQSTMESVHDVATVFRAMPARFRTGIADAPLVFYFSIEEEQWTVFVGPDTCEVKPGKAVDNADCFLKTSKEIFLGTINGTYTPTMTDLMMGKIKTNNPMLLQTFRDIFS